MMIASMLAALSNGWDMFRGGPKPVSSATLKGKQTLIKKSERKRHKPKRFKPTMDKGSNSRQWVRRRLFILAMRRVNAANLKPVTKDTDTFIVGMSRKHRRNLARAYADAAWSKEQVRRFKLTEASK